MGFVLSSTIKDLRRRLNDPLGLLLWAGLPFAVLALLLLAFGSGGNVTPQAHLLLVDHDESFLSSLLTGAFRQGPMAEMILLEQVEESEGRDRIATGDGSALLIIPEGFSSDVLEERPVTLTLITNPAQNILPGIIEETLSIMVDGTFYLQRLVGPELREIAGQPTDDTQEFVSTAVAVLQDAANDLIASLGGVLFPPLLQLETTVEVEDAGPDLNIAALFFQSMFFMSIFFMAQGQSDDVWIEREQGTLRRALTTPQAITKVLAGKMLTGGVLFAGVSTLALITGFRIFDFQMERLPLAVLWAAFSGVLLLSLFTLLQVHAGSQQAGNILASLVTFPLIMIGGSFFPFEMMPDWLAAVGRWTPNGWALQQLKDILDGAATPIGIAVAFTGLSAVATAAFLLSAAKLRRGFGQS